MATEMVDLRIRVSEKKRERLKILKTEFGFKSMNRLVNIFIDAGFDRIEDKFHFIDKEQGDEIKKNIVQIANDVHTMKLDLHGIAVNLNQIARTQNRSVKLGVTTHSSSSSSDIFLMREIEDLEKRLERLRLSPDPMGYIPQTEALLEKKKAKLQPQIPEISVSSGENVSVDECIDEVKATIKNLSKELTEASEKLGKELWKILS